MPFNIRNIIIFVSLAVAFTFIYVKFIKDPAVDSNLISSFPSATPSTVVSTGTENVIATNFLSLLLNIKNIKLDDSIFSDPAFQSLRDSSIELIPDVNAGRLNPFAPFGSDPAPVVQTSTITPPTTSTVTTPTTDVVVPPVTPPKPTTPTTPTTGGATKTQ